MKFIQNRRRSIFLFLIAILTAIVLYPSRRLVVAWPMVHRQKIFSLPPSGRFIIVYDDRRKGHHAMGDFLVVGDGKIRFLRMIYKKPMKGIETYFNAKDITEDEESVFVRQNNAPVPALHIVVSKVKNQALILDGQAIKFRELFPEGAVLTIKTDRRPRVAWWLSMIRF